MQCRKCEKTISRTMEDMYMSGFITLHKNTNAHTKTALVAAERDVDHARLKYTLGMISWRPSTDLEPARMYRMERNGEDKNMCSDLEKSDASA